MATVTATSVLRSGTERELPPYAAKRTPCTAAGDRPLAAAAPARREGLGRLAPAMRAEERGR